MNLLSAICRFAKDNLNFSLNTDDPLLFDNTLDDEMNIARRYFCMSDKQLIKTVSNVLINHCTYYMYSVQ